MKTKIVTRPADLIPHHPNDYPWIELHGAIQMRMAVFDKERGWLICRNSIACVKSTHYLDDEDEVSVAEAVTHEAKSMLRSMSHRWKEEA